MASNSSSSSDPNPSCQDEGFDELADSFAASFSVTNAVNDTNRPHPRFAQYKMKSSSISQVSYIVSLLSKSKCNFSMQDVRRERHLQNQKARRDDFMNISRCLADGDLDEEMGEEEEEEEDMDTTVEVGQCLVPMAT